MKTDSKNICPHGFREWVDPKSNKVSSEYIQGYYSRIRCDAQDGVCSFKDYKECRIYEKWEKD